MKPARKLGQIGLSVSLTLILLTFVFAVLFGVSGVRAASDTPIMTGILDGTLTGGFPKAIELYIDGTVDLSDYTLWKSSNGGAFGQVATLSGTYTNEFVYLTNDATQFSNVFGSSGDFANVFVDSDVNGNGDDGFQIRDSGGTIVIDQIWQEDTTYIYLDSFMYRNDQTGPDGGWVSANWFIPGNNVLDGLDAAGIAAAVPFGTFSYGPANPRISFEQNGRS